MATVEVYNYSDSEYYCRSLKYDSSPTLNWASIVAAVHSNARLYPETPTNLIGAQAYSSAGIWRSHNLFKCQPSANAFLAGTVINSAQVRVKPDSLATGSIDFKIVSNDELTDYSAVISSSTLTPGSWNNISLNAAGVAAIQAIATVGGSLHTFLPKIVINSEPAWVSGRNYGFYIYLSGGSPDVSYYVDYSSPPIAPSLLTASCVGGIAEATLSPNPRASFTSDVLAGKIPLTVTFTNTSTGAGLTYLWEFGDGSTSTSASPSHTYTSEGTYTPRLTATDSLGRISSTRGRILASSEEYSYTINPPIASFTASPMIGVRDPGTGLLAVTFTNTTTGSDTAWSWKADGVEFSTAENPSYNFASDGVKVVTLTAYDANGFESTAQKAIVVTSDPDAADNPPTATITASVSRGFAPLSVNFSASVSTPDVQYLWQFGDGMASTDAAPQHIFGMPGTYEVTLMVENTYGSSQASITIIVQGTIHFSGDPGIGFYIIDKKNNRILMYDENQVYFGAMGGTGPGDHGAGSTIGQFNMPTTLFVVRPSISG